jgi:hypothetical protein
MIERIALTGTKLLIAGQAAAIAIGISIGFEFNSWSIGLSVFYALSVLADIRVSLNER